MGENLTSEIIDGGFITDSDAEQSYEELVTQGYNRLVKVMRQGRWFLLKGLKPEFAQQPMYLDLLKKEYELSIQMDHPNVVKALYKEVDPEIGPCVVLEYVDGETLDKFLETKPSVSERKKVVDQLLDALKYVHGKQIIHRDLKPGNILITHNGHNVKIIDFGLSDADDYAILKQPAGTVKYMAPEQLDAETKIDGRADIYAFGLLLREIFPHRYRHIAAKCSRLDRERRFANVEAVKKAFDRRSRLLWLLPVIIGLALAVISSVFVRPIIVERNPNGYSDEFTELLGRAEHIIDSMYQPIIDELNEGKNYGEVVEEFNERVVTCRALLQDIHSPLLDDPKTSAEFRSAWEQMHADKYNEVCFMMFDQSQTIMNQHELD